MRMLNGGSQKSKVDPWLQKPRKKRKISSNFMFSRPVNFYGGVRQCPLNFMLTQPTTHHTAESSIIPRRRKLRGGWYVVRASIGGGGGGGGAIVIA